MQRGGKRQREGGTVPGDREKSLKMDPVVLTGGEGKGEKPSPCTGSPEMFPLATDTFLREYKTPSYSSLQPLKSKPSLFFRGGTLRTRQRHKRFCLQTQADQEYWLVPFIPPTGWFDYTPGNAGANGFGSLWRALPARDRCQLPAPHADAHGFRRAQSRKSLHSAAVTNNLPSRNVSAVTASLK